MSEDNIFENEEGMGAPSMSQPNNTPASDMYVDETVNNQQTVGGQQTTSSYNSQNGYSQTNAQNQYNSSSNANGQPQYTVIEQPKKGLAIASMILGILSLVAFCTCINIPFAIVGLILGIVYLAKKEELKPGKGMAIAGVITSALAIINCVVYWVFCLKLAASFMGSVDMNQYNQYTDPGELYEELFKDIYDFQYNDNNVIEIPNLDNIQVPKTDDTL